MKVRMKICKQCEKQYASTNGNQSYCSNVCRQQGYYKRHDIDRSFPHNIFPNDRSKIVNNTFTRFAPMIGDVVNQENPVLEPLEPLEPAKVNKVSPLIETSHKGLNIDNFVPILEQMNKTHQAQMEAMEMRLKQTFAQTLHEREIKEKLDVISRLQDELQSFKSKSDINTQQLIGGLSNVIAGIDLKDILK